MPTKELLSAVFGRTVSDVKLLSESEIGYYFYDEPRVRSPFWEIPYHQINIYEFMHNCKVFAWESAGIVIMSSIAALDDPLVKRKARCTLTYWNIDEPVIKYFDHTYEFYVVLQACQFILDNKLLKATHDTTTN